MPGQPFEQVRLVQRGVHPPPARQREHARREVEALQAPHQGSEGEPGQPRPAPEVEPPPLAGRRPGLPQRGGEQLRRPVAEPAFELRVEALGEAVEQVAHVPRRRPVRHRGPAERREQEPRLRHQRGARRSAGQRRLGRRGGAVGVADLPPRMGEGEVRFGGVRGERRRPLQGLQRRPRVAQRGEGLAEVAERDRVVGAAAQRGAEEADRLS